MISTKDSSNPGIPIVITTDVKSYVWFVPGRKFPVFQINYTSVSSTIGPSSSGKVVQLDANSTPTDVRPIMADIPDGFSLSQNYPNPFNPSTTVSFSIPTKEQVTLRVLNLLGSEVATLLDQQLSPGEYKTDFNAANLPSGLYFYRLSTGGYSAVKKLMLVR